MKTLVVAVMVALAVPVYAENLVGLPECLGGVDTYPDTPTPPVSVGSSQGATFELWRLECIVPAGVFLALTRITGGTGCLEVTYRTTFRTCKRVTFALLKGPDIAPGLSVTPDREAVTLSYRGAIIVSLPALPPADQPSTVTVVSRGCSPCGIGEAVSLWAQITNPNPSPVTVRVVSTLFGPEGFELPLSPPDDQVIPPGASELPLLQTIVGADVPAGSYLLEVAILEPPTGVTLSRSRVRAERR
jgi:hypothetical protein